MTNPKFLPLLFLLAGPAAIAQTSAKASAGSEGQLPAAGGEDSEASQDILDYCSKSFADSAHQTQCAAALAGKKTFDFSLKFCDFAATPADQTPKKPSAFLECLKFVSGKAFTLKELIKIYDPNYFSKSFLFLHFTLSPEDIVNSLKRNAEKVEDISYGDENEGALIVNCVNTNLHFEIRRPESPFPPLFRRVISHAEILQLADLHPVQFVIATEGEPLVYDLPETGMHVIKWVEENRRFELFPESGNIICR